MEMLVLSLGMIKLNQNIVGMIGLGLRLMTKETLIWWKELNQVKSDVLEIYLNNAQITQIQRIATTQFISCCDSFFPRSNPQSAEWHPPLRVSSR